MKAIYIEVITPSKQAYSGNAMSITVPGSAGNFQVLHNHAPLLSSFEIGKVKIVEQDGNILLFSTGGGTVEVLKNNILLLAESFEPVKEIDVERANEALKRAKERLAKKHEIKIDNARAEAALKRAINRLKLTGNYKP